MFSKLENSKEKKKKNWDDKEEGKTKQKSEPKWKSKRKKKTEWLWHERMTDYSLEKILSKVSKQTLMICFYIPSN